MTDLGTEFDRMIDDLADDIERTMRTVAIGGILSGFVLGAAFVLFVEVLVSVFS